MSLRPFATSLALAASLFAGVAVADEKWEILTTVSMTGMPFQVPPTTVTVCVPPGGMKNEKMVPKQDSKCRMDSLKTVGNTTSFRMSCPAPQSFTGEGQVTRSGDSAYSGSMNARGNAGGHAFDMKTTYSGRKVGACDGKETVNGAKLKQAQDRAATAQETRNAVAPPAGQQMDPAKMMEQMQKMKQMYGQ